MHYTLEEIDTFLTVMDLGTVTAAAARLNLSKSVISKRLSDLETGLGVALFRRNAGRLSPTEAAEGLAGRLRPALADLRAAAESAAWGGRGEVLRGRLSVAVPMSFGTLHLSPVIAAFARQHPELELRIDYDDRARDLAREGFDVGVRLGELTGGALKSRRLCEDRRLICASPEFLARHGRPETVADLNGLASVGYSHVANADLWQLSENGRLVQPQLMERISVNNGEAMRELALAGTGIAILPGFIAAEAVKQGRLVQLLPQVETRHLPLVVVWPPVTPMPLKLRLFIDHLVASFQGEAPWLEGLG